MIGKSPCQRSLLKNLAICTCTSEWTVNSYLLPDSVGSRVMRLPRVLLDRGTQQRQSIYKVKNSATVTRKFLVDDTSESFELERKKIKYWLIKLFLQGVVNSAAICLSPVLSMKYSFLREFIMALLFGKFSIDFNIIACSGVPCHCRL